MGPVKESCLQRRVLVNVTQDSIVRLLPPLIIDGDQAGLIVEAVCEGIEAM